MSQAEHNNMQTRRHDKRHIMEKNVADRIFERKPHMKVREEAIKYMTAVLHGLCVRILENAASSKEDATCPLETQDVLHAILDDRYLTHIWEEKALRSWMLKRT